MKVTYDSSQVGTILQLIFTTCFSLCLNHRAQYQHVRRQCSPQRFKHKQRFVFFGVSPLGIIPHLLGSAQATMALNRQEVPPAPRRQRNIFKTYCALFLVLYAAECLWTYALRDALDHTMHSSVSWALMGSFLFMVSGSHPHSLVLCLFYDVAVEPLRTAFSAPWWQNVVYPVLLFNVLYWVSAAMFDKVLHTRAPRIQNDADTPRLGTKEFNVVSINMIGVVGILLCINAAFDTFPTGPDAMLGSTHWDALHDFMFSLVGNELLFYWVHRVLHHRWWYRHVHRTHHTFSAPTAWTATYCHTLEMILANIFPLFCGCALFRTPFPYVVRFACFVILGTQSHHSGRAWRCMKQDIQPQFHDAHHRYKVGNYGMSGTLDEMHGTLLTPSSTNTM